MEMFSVVTFEVVVQLFLSKHFTHSRCREDGASRSASSPPAAGLVALRHMVNFLLCHLLRQLRALVFVQLISRMKRIVTGLSPFRDEIPAGIVGIEIAIIFF